MIMVYGRLNRYWLKIITTAFAVYMLIRLNSQSSQSIDLAVRVGVLGNSIRQKIQSICYDTILSNS